MKSRQINLFYLPKEWADIERFLKEQNVVFVRNQIDEVDDFIVKEIPLFKGSPAPTLFITLPAFHGDIVFKKNPSLQKYFVDVEGSFVIQFSNVGFIYKDPFVIQRSRFYYTAQYYFHGEKMIKDDIFVNWAADFFKRFKKQFLPRSPAQSMIWLSKKARDWMSIGGGEMNAAATEISVIKPF